MPGVVSRGRNEGTIISLKVVGKGKGGDKVYCVMIREIDVP